MSMKETKKLSLFHRLKKCEISIYHCVCVCFFLGGGRGGGEV